MTLKNVLYLFPDCQYINTKNIHHIKPLSLTPYLPSNHIIYIIQYKSKDHTTTSYKYTIIKPKHNTFDIVKNRFEKYFHEMAEKIRIKGGMIYPCLLEGLEKVGSKYKVVKL
jgi:hypothetical protein